MRRTCWSLLSAILAALVLVIGWEYEIELLCWIASFALLGLFGYMAYVTMTTSLRKRYPAQGSAPETWRLYH